ncbi:MAG: hypothetical protein IJZ85_08905 [Lachnospiraceae bacterium]|nr:hypothetical protein [Lachnospiraceae bacterium]
MIERLILAYRAEIYEWTVPSIVKFIKEKWKVLLIVLLPAIVILGIGILAICFEWNILIYILLLFELVYVFIVDRYIVKSHQKGLCARKEHLLKVRKLLKSFCPSRDICKERELMMIIDRLTEIIENGNPIKNLGERFIKFVKGIIFPIVGFFAGISATHFGNMDLDYIIDLGIGIIVCLGAGYVLWICLTKAVHSMVFRDYDAALALREDIKDILLFYTNSEENLQ